MVDNRFAPKAPQKYYWTNEGITAYHDGGVYIDPYYTFHANGSDDYQIVYIPVYVEKFMTRDKAYYEKSGAKFMWRCTACWDNFMKAQTIEEAIEEFEVLYHEKLWNSIEHYQERLMSATAAFKQFNTYRREKK
jgi:hypothetical protein